MIRTFAAYLIFLTSVLAGANEFHYSAERLRRISDPERPSTLLYLLPLMEEVYSMTINSGGDTLLLRDDNLAESWGESFFRFSDAEVVLTFQGEVYRDLESLSFRGTPLDSGEGEVWVSWEGIDLLREIVDEFSDRHHIDITVRDVPSPDSKLVSVVRARGDVPELVMIQNSAVDRLVRNRAIQSLDYLTLPDLMPAGLDAFTLDGRLQAVPFYFDTQVFLANPNLVQLDSGSEWYLAELEQAASGIHAAVPMGWNAYSSNWLLPFIYSWGRSEIIDAHGRIRIDDEPTRQSLIYLNHLIDNGLLQPMERDAMDARFIAGDIGIIMTGSYSIPYFEHLGVSFTVLPFPVNQETGLSLTPLLDYKGFCIPRRTDSPVLARRLIQYLTGNDVQVRFRDRMAKLAVRDDIPSGGGAYSDVLEESARHGKAVPPDQVYSIYKNTMWKLLRFAMSGRMSVDQTLTAGQELMDNSIEY